MASFWKHVLWWEGGGLGEVVMVMVESRLKERRILAA